MADQGDARTNLRIGTDVWRADLDEHEQARLADLLQRLADDPFLNAVARRSVELMELRHGDRVLDLGCGSGVLLPALSASVGPDGAVVGLDYSSELLEKARERIAAAYGGAAVSLVQADATAVPLDDDSFEAAHVERVLMHLDDPDAALRELRRVVRSGGRVVAAEPDGPSIRVDHAEDPEGYALIAARDIQRMRNPGMGVELKRRLVFAGFTDVRIEVLTDYDDDYDPVAAAGDREAAEELIAEGLLTRERAEAALGYLDRASEGGYFTWIGSMVIAAARVP